MKQGNSYPPYERRRTTSALTHRFIETPHGTLLLPNGLKRYERKKFLQKAECIILCFVCGFISGAALTVLMLWFALSMPGLASKLLRYLNI